jgi:hypothetical protein
MRKLQSPYVELADVPAHDSPYSDPQGGHPKPKRPDVSKYEATQTFDPDTALRLLEESLSYFTPVPVPKATAQDYEDLPVVA